MVITQSYPCATASASRNSSLRTCKLFQIHAAVMQAVAVLNSLGNTIGQTYLVATQLHATQIISFDVHLNAIWQTRGMPSMHWCGKDP